VEDAAIILNGLTGYDTWYIASVEHPTEDYVARNAAVDPGLRIAFRARHFRYGGCRCCKAVEDEIGVSCENDQERKDCTLPRQENIVLAGESSAYHEEFTATERRIPDSHAARTANGANIKGVATFTPAGKSTYFDDD